ncbi:uncharacterized protein LOC100202072 isoform X2 [Hydra vulgaris]|uniref:uncharacterized protein LOC100202072 isoform X2 n=1 Tax=Hydra vulgaris TaxID=6087 RepID=UPI001F5FCBD3|nr:uncharacterized protein LOC100202072 isoform X2 [Hydra vulgaris]
MMKKISIILLLSFVFIDIELTTGIPLIAQTCEGNDLKIDCKGKGTIELIYANYGRTSSGICPGSMDSNTKCDNHQNSLQVVRNICSSKSSCVIKAANAVFGDPCVGTYKYLEVQYYCKPLTVVRSCEGSDLKIDCKDGGTIEVVYANYGRTLSSICPGSKDSNTKCDNHQNSLQVVRNSCSSKTSCVIKAVNAVFGDPCVGTYKYLEVQYYCKPLTVVRSCEGSDLKIDCKDEGTIEVVYANYGRTLSSICPGSKDSNTKCDNHQKSLQVVRNSCSSKTSCVIKAVNAVFGDPCVGTYKYLEVQYYCKPLTVVRSCEGSDLKIDCKDEGTIEVVYANYGRTLSSICPGSKDSNTKCDNHQKSLQVVRNSCSSKTSCVIKAVNAVFGDPCVGTYKYLEVQYYCKPLTVVRSCEGSDLKIDCKDGGTIEVIYANYGRTLSSICPGSKDSNTKCDNHQNSLQVVRNICSSKSYCVIKAANAVFGDPCVGTYKYLEVQYYCKPLTVVRSCEGSDLKIDCKDGGTIEVVYANYGRTLSSICPGSKDSNTKCDNHQNSLQVVRNSCSSKTSCVIKAVNAVFGDPCVGTYKYLEVQYYCKPFLNVARSCEGNDLKIDCKDEGTIEVVYANYGRTSSGICPGSMDSNTKCDNHKKSLQVVRNSCSSRTSCVIKAVNAVFGDPCVGTYKYLEVQYYCKPRLHVVQACEGTDLKIDCKGNGKIEVVYANYGRTSSGICPGSNDSNIKCNNQINTLQIVRNSCSAKFSCVISAANSVFGDPCVGTYKYLEVKFYCKL